MQKISFEKNTFLRVIGELSKIGETLDPKKKYLLEIKLEREKRSLDANAYFWVLCDKLAEKINKGKSEIYKDLVKEIGGNCEIVCIQKKAADTLCRNWGSGRIGWPTEIEQSKIDGCVNVRLYYGSSTYDTAQMARLIDLIVQECQQQDIETKTPEELAKLKGLWQ